MAHDLEEVICMVCLCVRARKSEMHYCHSVHRHDFTDFIVMTVRRAGEHFMDLPSVSHGIMHRVKCIFSQFLIDRSMGGHPTHLSKSCRWIGLWSVFNYIVFLYTVGLVNQGSENAGGGGVQTFVLEKTRDDKINL